VNFQGMYLGMKHLFISGWTDFTRGFYFPLSPVKFQSQTEWQR